MDKAYDYRNCSSLFGYAASVHARSGGICQLCGSGSQAVDFDLWRQLTVEHLIGASQGGYLNRIRDALAEHLPELPASDREALARRIDEANTVTACSFCNSTTSRNQAPVAMTAAIMAAPADPDAVFAAVTERLALALEVKRRDVGWKLAAVRKAFDDLVAPGLLSARG